MTQTIVFGLLALVACLSAIKVVTAKHPVKSVLALVVVFAATAGTWMLLYAEFLSLVLIVVYVGAVMVLFLFVVMMLDVERAETSPRFVGYWPIAAGLALLLFILLFFLIKGLTVATPVPDLDTQASNVTQIGLALFNYYLYPLEVAAVVLLVAMIAAIALTFRGRKSNDKAQKVREQVRVNPKDRLRWVEGMDAKTGDAP